MSAASLTLISEYNRQVLCDIGTNTFQKHLKTFYEHHPRVRVPEADGNSTCLGRLWRWLNPWQIGERLGIAVGITYAADVARRIITEIATVYFGDNIDTWFSSGIQAGLIEGARVAFTPLVQPFIVAGIGFAGGLIVSAIFGAIEALYHLWKGRRGPVLELHDIQEVTALVHIENGRIINGAEEYTTCELEDIIARTHAYVLCQQLMRLERENVETTFDHYVTIDAGSGERKLIDGHVLTGDELAAFEGSKRYLKGNNPMKEKRAIRKTIKLFARHKAVVEARQMVA